MTDLDQAPFDKLRASSEALHEHVMAWHVERGVPDHPFEPARIGDVRCSRCRSHETEHHRQMHPYGELAPEVRAAYRAVAAAVLRATGRGD